MVGGRVPIIIPYKWMIRTRMVTIFLGQGGVLFPSVTADEEAWMRFVCPSTRVAPDLP
jgi:hypothetical protein